MQPKTLKALEFHKVLGALAAYAVSEPGAAACHALRPLTEPDLIEAQSLLYRQAVQWIGETGFRLEPFPDLAGLFVFLARPDQLLDLDALWALRQVLIQAKSARTCFCSIPDADERWPHLAHLLCGYSWPAAVYSGLNRCLSDDGRLKDESSPDLLAVRTDIRRIHQNCTKKVKEFILEHSLSHYLQDDYMTLSSDRYVLPLKSNFKGRFPGVIHHYSQTGETCYFEPLPLVDLNNQVQELKQDERTAEREVLSFLTGLVRQEKNALQAADGGLVQLDVLWAKTAFAVATQGAMLTLSEDAALRLRGARHPLLAAMGEPVVPVDLELRPGQRGLIVSGGNAGGKTVCLKTLGLSVLLTMAGVPVPVEEGGCVPFWRKVFVFMGDEQSLEDHVSTFTAQIRHVAEVWDELDAATLVILDEFGAGTDPSQGAALAQALVDGLLDRQAWVAAATHFPALKTYALTKPEVRAASVLFDPLTKKPLYSLGYDQVGASQALDAAREHGLPDAVLRRAEQYLLLDGPDTGALMERLNRLAVEREQELAHLRTEQERLREKRRTLDERYAQERKALFDELKKRSQDILRDWQQEKLGRRQAMRELAKVRNALEVVEGAEETGTLRLEELAPGTAVVYRPWEKPGVVLELDEKRGTAKVDLSGVSMWINTTELMLGRSAGGGTQGTGGQIRGSGEAAGLTLDLRGWRVDAALSELAAFIDRALLGNFTQLEIIHGRGTGALRREIHGLLRECPAVESFHLAPEDQGGDGLTVVDLK